MENNKPTIIPTKKLPIITITLEMVSLQNKNSTFVISAFWTEKIMISTTKIIAIMVLAFMLLSLIFFDGLDMLLFLSK